MRVVVAIDKFKGSLTAEQAAARVRAGVAAVWPDAEVEVVPVADGGDGTLDAAVRAGFTLVDVACTGPIGEPVMSGYAVRDRVAVVELADSCGLLRLPRRPDGEVALAGWRSSSRGLGEVMVAALESGCRQLVVGLGGSASTDGGAGLLQALGARLLDSAGEPIDPGAGGLRDLATADLSGLHPALAAVDLVVATDVDSPLLGDAGAAAVFGPQKGLDALQVLGADAGLTHLADVVEPLLGRAERDTPGAGAAGGAGWGLLVLGGRVERGIDVVLGWSQADQMVAGADLVITGEGSLDEQSLAGKAPIGVADLAARHGVPAVVISGRRTISEAQLTAAGFTQAVALNDLEPDLARCQSEAGPLVEQATALLLRRLRLEVRAETVELELHEGRDAVRFAEAVWPLYDAVFPGADHERWVDEQFGRHAAREGFRLALARRGAELLGFAWGHTGQRGQYWSDLVADSLGEAAQGWVGGHFEFVELGVVDRARGQRIGAQLHDLLLDGLPHHTQLLSTSSDPDDPGHRLYQARGWQVLGRLPSGGVVMGRRPRGRHD